MRIDVDGVSKRFGHVRAVEELSFTVRPGAITGFLGPNGSGKSTTMRIMLGLVSPDTGSATIGGRRYAELEHPTRTVGAVLDTMRAHPAMTCLDHLRLHARLSGHPVRQLDAAAEQTGVATFAARRVRTLSTGMRQRLALATALLGDPGVLVLDEPANGLDPQGLAWLRDLLTRLAAEGRTVLVSSHVLAELEVMADDVVIIAEGRLVTAGPLREVLAAAGEDGAPARSLEQVFLSLTNGAA
ncbi:ABC transporter [Prauserella sp. PE36]|uniref:ABC transporter ATP-binding protein n=1 Tax=Prauserella sp. PE36 TaxID=1504709 RepID=UPI000DE36D18|nr:ATP-binding cassette domain-containing protein [Prauserella sp. PE36]RBM18774.1 ABC transporter [Prauserella sp. PE36]